MQGIHSIWNIIAGLFQGLSKSQMHGLVLGSMVCICVGLVLLVCQVYQIGLELRKQDVAGQLYERAQNVVRESRFVNYRKLQSWLKVKGAGYVIKGFEDPFKFLVTNAGLVLGILLLMSWITNIGTAILLAVVAVVIEILYLTKADSKNNKAMLEDMAFLYDATAIQLTSNIYVAEAVYNCISHIRSKRLKQALMELCNSMMLGGDVRNATKDFCEKFDNSYLNTFCNAIVQITTETGVADKLIEDMSVQLMALKEATFLAKKKETESKLQLCVIGIFLVFTVLIFYLSISSMSGTVGVLY